MSELFGDEIKAVFFDHDDTLVGTIGPKWEQHRYIARTHYNKDLTDDELRLHWGKPLDELMRMLYGTDDAGRALEHTVECHKNFPKELFAASIPTLKRLKNQGKIIGIVTANRRFSFDHDLELHKVPLELIDYTQTQEETQFHKPDPRVFNPAKTWLNKQNISPEEVVYVGDGLQDMKAALGAGFNFVGVETGLVTAEEFKKAGATSISSIAKLI